VVVFIPLLEPSEDGHCAGFIWFFHVYQLETAFQCLVFLEVLLVFVERGSADGPEFTPGQGWFEDIGSVHGALTPACTHQGVNLVDEEDDFTFRLDDFVDHRFQPFFKLTLVFGTGHQGPHVQRKELLGFQVFRYVAPDNTVGQSFSNGCLSCAWLADKDGIVLGASAQYLQHTPDFFVSADDGVQLARASPFIEVDSVFAQGIVRVFGRLTVDFGALPQGLYGFVEYLLGQSIFFQKLAYGVFFNHQGQQKKFDGRKLVATLFGKVNGFLQHLVGVVRQVGFPVGYTGVTIQ